MKFLKIIHCLELATKIIELKLAVIKISLKKMIIFVPHPHQIYFEFLSEHGLIGTILLLLIFFILIFKNLKKIIGSQNYLQIGAFIFLICNFLPLLPSGAFLAILI